MTERQYVILVCAKCRRPIMAEAEARTRVCPHCGKRNIVIRSSIISVVRGAREAADTLKSLKEAHGSRAARGEIHWKRMTLSSKPNP